MKKILFSVLGLSPQILTETLFALKNEGNLPDEIHVLTTERGASLSKKALFHEEGGWFYRFCKDWKVSGIKFQESNIHTIKDMQGGTLADIRTDEHNQAIANQIVEYVRRFTQEQDSSLHVSIAGGRKTMGFFAGYALSMFGREQDCLSHVLISENFEGHPKFFYPTPDSTLIRTRDGQELLDCKEATVELAYLPFLAMRSVIPDTFTQENLGYDDMVKRLQKRVFDKKVLVSADDFSVSIGGETIKLSKVNFVFYYWVLLRIKEDDSPVLRPYVDEPVMEYGDSFLELSGHLLNEMDDDDKTRGPMEKSGMAFEFVRDRTSAIKKSLVKALGAQNAEDFILHYDKKTRQIAPRLQAHQIEFI